MAKHSCIFPSLKHLALSLAVIIVVTYLGTSWQPNVWVCAQSNSTKSMGTFETIVADIFNNDTEITQPIFNYLDGIQSDSNFTSKAKDALKAAGEVALSSGDEKHLLRSLIEVIFRRGNETLAKSKCRPCPACEEEINTTTSSPTSSPKASKASTVATTKPTKAPDAGQAPSTRAPFGLPGLPTLPPLSAMFNLSSLLPGLKPLNFTRPSHPGSSRASLDELISTTSPTTSSTSSKRPTRCEEGGERDSTEDEYKEEDEHEDYSEISRKRRSPKISNRNKRDASEEVAETNEQLLQQTVQFLLDDPKLSAAYLDAFGCLPKETSDAQHKLATDILSHFKVFQSGKQANSSMIIIGYLLDQFRLFKAACKVCPACEAHINMRGMRARNMGARGRSVAWAPPNRRTSRRGPPPRWAPPNRGQWPANARKGNAGGGPPPHGQPHHSGGGGPCGSAPLNPLSAGAATGYIQGGDTAKYGEWPSYVSVKSGTGSCGGVLVSSTSVMTAAHCVVNGGASNVIPASSFTVIVGQHDIKSMDSAEKRYSVTRVCKATSYSVEGVAFDYAVLTVAGTVALSDYVQPACLPDGSVATSGPGSTCYLAGLGITGYIGERTQNPRWLQKLKVQHASCSVYGIPANDPSRICFSPAGGRRATSCIGDSGGPVLCLNSSKKWVVVGLVSAGPFCKGGNNFISQYADVTKLLSTIRGQCGI